MADVRLLLEAERRGIELPAGDKALLEEAKKRGLVSIAEARKGLSEPTVTGQSLIPFLLSSALALATRGRGPVVIQALRSAGGAGFGAAAGEDISAAVGITPPERAPSFFDLAKTFGLVGLLDLVGQGTLAAGRRMLPDIGPRPGAQDVLRAMRETGVEPKLTDISGSTAPAMLERGVQQTAGGRAIVSETAERQAGQILRARDEFLARVTPEEAASAVAVGGRAGDAIKAQAKRVGEVEDFLWQELRGMATDLPVSTAGIKRVAQEIRLQQERLLPSQRNKKVLALVNDIDEAPETVLWQRADEWRREFGAGVQKGELITGVDPGQSSRLHAAVLGDMERAAATTDIAGLGQLYRQVRQFGAQARALFKDSQVARVVDADPEKVVDLLVSSGPSAIRRAREAVLGSPQLGRVAPDPQDVQTWNLVRRHILEGLFQKGIDKGAKGFVSEPLSGVRLENALERFGKEALEELLTPTERRALGNIVTVAKAVRLGERAGASAFTSGTAGALGIQGLLALPGAAAGATVGGALGFPAAGAAVGSAVGLMFTPVPLAKLLMNPRAAEFLASQRFATAARTTAQAGRVTGELARAGLRLTAILAEEEQRPTRAPAPGTPFPKRSREPAR